MGSDLDLGLLSDLGWDLGWDLGSDLGLLLGLLLVLLLGLDLGLFWQPVETRSSNRKSVAQGGSRPGFKFLAAEG